MKIVTVNVPESYIDSIEKLVGGNGLYPSRSELIRVAVREFLIRELKMADNMAKYKEEEVEAVDEDKYVRIPTERLNGDNQIVREFKTYKIIKRLNYDNQTQQKEDHGKFTWKLEFNQTYDPNPSIPEYNPLSLTELRVMFPDDPFIKFINEV